MAPTPKAFSDGARTTLWLTLVSGAVGLVLGTVAALARTARWVAVRWVASFYIWAIRGTPLLVQILFVYFALPVLVPGLNLPDFAAAGWPHLNVGAYNARSPARWPAGRATRPDRGRQSPGPGPHACVPGRGVPAGVQDLAAAAGQQLCGAAQDSSLAYAIGVVELTNVGNRIQSATFQPLPR